MNAALLLVFLLPLALAQTDDCLTYSYATKATAQIVALSASSFTSLTTSSEIESALESLYQIVTASSSPSVWNIYVGASNEDTYLVKNCVNQQGTNAYCSSSGPQYIAYVRNTAYFGDTVRHVFGFNSGSVDVVSNYYGFAPESSTYNTTGRFWYQTMGWSSVQSFVGGGSGKTYSQSFSTGLVAAADRGMNEFCGPCLSDSYAVAATQALAVSDFATAKAGITSASGFTAVATAIKTALDTVDSSYAVNGLLGFSNGDSYMVKYCDQLGSVGTTDCSGHDFLFYVTNYAVYGDSVRRALALDSNGTVGDVVVTLTTYDVTARAWFTVANGWSDTYTFASSDVTGRTYALAINGGVVGTDRSSTEPCGRNDQGSSTSSAPQVLASFVVLTDRKSVV